MRYSGFRVITEACSETRAGRPPGAIRRPRPNTMPSSSAGAAMVCPTAYYLPRTTDDQHRRAGEGLSRLGQHRRNTTIVRANYFLPGNSEFLQPLAEAVGGARVRTELQRHALASRPHQHCSTRTGSARRFVRRGNAMINQGDDAILLDREGVREHLPYLDFEQTRFPIYGGLLHPRGGSARHDAVAWGLCARRRSARRRPDPELRGHGHRHRERSREGRADHARAIRAKKVGIIVAGRSGQVAAMAGMRLPIESHILQAFVTEGLKPVIHHVISFGMGHSLHQPVRQVRAGVRRRPRFLRVLRESRQPADGPST